MKIYLLIPLLLFSFGELIAQTIVKGKIISNKNEVLEGASVFLNNTTIGTISNEKGEFELKIKNGNYDLVISYLGFKTQRIPINTDNKIEFITIKLLPETNILNEVVIEKTTYDDNWKHNLARFKQAFLGRTKLASECIILNEKDIHFNYNTKTNTLSASTKRPLKIKHTGLGYLITYDLIDFTLQQNQLFFSGYARYENLRKSIRKKWKNNRLEAYNGSQMHFLRSLLNQNLKQEGFVVNKFKRVMNPNRPSDEKIKLARELIQLHSGQIDLSKNIPLPKTPIDSAIVTFQKSKLPKYQDFLYKSNVPYEDMFSSVENSHYLNFKDYLMVVYTKEPEEANYLTGMFGKQKKATGVQTSNIVLLEGKSEIDPSGILANPNAVFNEGYWGFESFANMLPLDYQPPKN
ncbi:carboxypeptidase-like regulatory domain-containing protein [Tenacibaculum sp. IB213877]|uniref:carboxypeptidase-like regulatory domain-containing protein n=1 Tax=Tenacibaculum sp. IB213877 TaxID=3097351 RepID=UPI002A59DF15|nr:carboxypeptidase-like regulatory domain-containing protein [Tenacibaculum sp. IB213877]MDY0780207.1 carboxypeptidase-like regulatory domain-containing protein [Tenacibaculum sp. IB213877]